MFMCFYSFIFIINAVGPTPEKPTRIDRFWPPTNQNLFFIDHTHKGNALQIKFGATFS